MEELHIFRFVKQNEQQVSVVVKFIQTLKDFNLMHKIADLTNPNYTYRIWQFTKKYGASRAVK